MNKFRVISDIHIDVNYKHPLSINDDVFTVICGDTSGTPSESIEWIRKNIKAGVGISGNHLPYNNENKTIQELREELAKAFPISDSFTYLDCETDVFSKEVDGILFIGTCMYTNMRISHSRFNPEGDMNFNMNCSLGRMNDYQWGIKSKDNYTRKMISPNDYVEWFSNAYNKIEKLLNENEEKQSPLPVVLITHHPILTDFFGHTPYVEDANTIYSPMDFNYASYASDMRKWLKRHTSIKCYCCGHIHAIYNKYRNFTLTRDDGSKCLVVNNARGYVSRGHAFDFNVNTFVNTNDWTIETIPLNEKEIENNKKLANELLKNLAWSW